MKQVKLKDVTTNITDGKHGDCTNEYNSGFYFVSCKDVYDGYIHYENTRQITSDDFIDSHKRTKLEPDDILVTNSGTIGRMALIKDIPETYRTTFQKSVAIVKPNKKLVRPLYLYYCLLKCVDRFVNQSSGTAQKNLLLGTMREFSLDIDDDLYNQDKISSFLFQYDSLIEINNRRIKILEQMAENLYKEWFVRFRFPGHENAEFVEGVPKGWEYCKLKKLLNISYGKDHKNLEDGDIPIFGSGGIMRYGNKALYEGEVVLIPRKGTLNNIMYYSGKLWTVDTMFYAVPQVSKSAKYIYYTLNKFDMESYNSGAALPSMTTAILYNLKILLPDGETLARFDEIIDTMFDEKKILENQNQNLIKQRDYLLPRLMSGRLQVK